MSIRESSIPHNLDQFIDQYLGGKCFIVLDLYWGFDARKMDEASRDMTAFVSPLGLLRITSLPTGFTNSPSEFQEYMVFIFKDEIARLIMNIFIDDAPIHCHTCRNRSIDARVIYYTYLSGSNLIMS